MQSSRSLPAFATVAVLGGFAFASPTTLPSSHREAPFVTENPKVDATDFYMFTSYEPARSDYVTIVANYLPLQDAYGGPNYFTLDPNARYDIHVDTNGDAIEDLTFRFTFSNRLRDLALQVGPAGAQKTVSVPLKNIGPITSLDNSALNELEAYKLEVLSGPAAAPSSTYTVTNPATGGVWFTKPVDNIGKKSVADYAAYAAAHVYDVAFPGGAAGRMFVGQRKDPFVVNLGEVFDLVNLNPLGAPDAKENTIGDKNVTALILELPKSLFTSLPGAKPVIGGWTTASLPKTTTLNPNPGFANPTSHPVNGPYQQVSRLGMPLVNEVVIGLKDKNRFNASAPKDDGQFLDYVTNPTLPELLELLFGVTAPNQFPRNDLVQAFVTGIPGLNDNGGVGEMLRLNLGTPPVGPALQMNLGVLAGDAAGFPNGRRPGDDVVDIELRVAMGVLLDPAVAPSGNLPYADGATVNASMFLPVFPYLQTPLAGSPQ
jgi:hypothetical protein